LPHEELLTIKQSTQIEIACFRLSPRIVDRVNTTSISTIAQAFEIDSDPLETREWQEALDAMLHFCGPERCSELLNRLFQHARNRQIPVRLPLNTPYCNTIHHNIQPAYPGDLELERRIIALVRWNAVAMVVQANKQSLELGGHLSSYASGAELFEVGFNHFFHGNEPGAHAKRTADLVFFQPHSAPGVYARAFLEGRLTAEQLAHFRRETGGHGLCSYPHPWLMPHFWQFPTGSMGLGPLTAVYQARFMHYLHNRNLMDPARRKVWAFVGDGEMDEPESIAGLTLAARENLENLILVINCNLQRLDGPVRGNGSIIQELERLFAGAGWNVIKLLWGSDWDALFDRDVHSSILRRLHETVDGELQSYAAHDASFNRQRFFNKYEELRELVADIPDQQIDSLTRGGHDPAKIYAAFDAAVRHHKQPTVILAQTKKGYGLGRWAEGRMSAHQQKKLDHEALRHLRDRLELPLTDEQADAAEFYRPDEDSPELRYLYERRAILRGFVPMRIAKAERLKVPPRESFANFAFTLQDREMSTTVAFVRMLSSLLKDKQLGKQIVPIVADEARTFGMESLFRNIGIYSHCGQLYEPEDQKHLLYYKELRDGQLLEEGITEAGALSSWIAAGTSYSHHGLPMVPFYIFYSIFGFQRVGDLIWAAADSRARGFLLGATAGRTTLSGEGLQHQDGSSHLTASTVPNCRAYDPCFAHELAVILEHGMRTILEKQEDVFYYVTVMNENYIHVPMPQNSEPGILHGMYRLRSSSATESSDMPRVQLLGSGTILREALAAAEILELQCNISADVWSVTSFTELRRSGMKVERSNRLRFKKKRDLSWVEECLSSTRGPIIAASDYVRAVPDLIRTWVPRRYVTLGTDGFGRSDTRADIRQFFEVDRINIALAAVHALMSDNEIDESVAELFLETNGYRLRSTPPWVDASAID
jgi:pyruvate dehydrogenase E1 component